MEDQTELNESRRVAFTAPAVLHSQMEEIASRDGWTTMAGFAAHLNRLGLSSYCEGDNKIKVNLKLGKENGKHPG